MNCRITGLQGQQGLTSVLSAFPSAILRFCSPAIPAKGPSMKSAIEIANSAELLPITDVAAAAGILPEELIQFGRDRGKVRLSILERLAASTTAR